MRALHPHQAAPRRCRRGHDGAWLASGRCAECAREYEARRPTNSQAEKRKADKYRAANREVMLERTRIWRAAHPDRHLAAVNRWKEANPESARIHVRSRKARRLSAQGDHTPGDLAAIYKAQRGRCAYCRCRLTEANKQVDHIIALTKGGSNDRRNLQYLCDGCNAAKHNRDPLEFAARRGLLL